MNNTAPVRPELAGLLQQCIEVMKAMPDAAIFGATAAAKYEAWALILKRVYPVSEREYAEIKLRWLREFAGQVRGPGTEIERLLVQLQDARTGGRLN
jgi:hypothetical protein